MTLLEIQELIKLHSNDQLSQEPGMVYQVWEDGEVTLQKSGDILWQRSLHCIKPGMSESINPNNFPHQTERGNGYIFTTEEGTKIIRAAIAELYGLKDVYANFN